MRVLVAVAALLAVCGAELISVNTNTRRYVDSDGRELTFHGLNVVAKNPPYYPWVDCTAWSLCEPQIQALASVGCNAIRLGVMWSGVVPEQRGQVNATYLQAIRETMLRVWDYGMYVIVDAHQDLFSPAFCADGAPAWAADLQQLPEEMRFPEPLARPYPVDPVTKLPSWQNCSKFFWNDYYFTAAVAHHFQMLYENEAGMRDAFGEYWAAVVSALKDLPNILGYELINEPFAGDFYADPELLVPTVADKKNLAPLYEFLNGIIRPLDNDHIVFFEPVTWDDFGCGFENVPGGSAYLNRTALSYHFYVPPDISTEQMFDAREKDMTRLKCAGFLTEYDLVHLDNFYETMDLAAKLHQSFTGWDFWSVASADNQSIQPKFVKMLSRTYAQAVAGTVLTASFNNATADFFLSFQLSRGCERPTVIFLNAEQHYPGGYNVVVSPTGALHMTSTPPYLLNFLPSPNTPDGSIVNVSISATS